MVGLEPEFPLWLGLISLPLTFVGDPRWFLPSLGLGLPRREIPQCWGEGVEAKQTQWGTSMSMDLRCPLAFFPSAPLSSNWHTQCFISSTGLPTGDAI